MKQSVGLLNRIGFAMALVCAAISGANFARAEDARVLPRGRSRLSMIYGRASGISQTFNNDGNVQSVTAPYNIQLDSSTLRRFDSDLNMLVQLMNDTRLHYDPNLCDTPSKCLTDDVSKPLIGDALARGVLNVDAEANRRQFNWAYEYGVTDRLSIGLMVPYIHTEVHVDPRVNGANTATKLYDALGGAYPGKINEGLNRLRLLNTENFQNMLVTKGYNRFGDYEGAGLGDVLLGARYNYVNDRTRSGEWINSFQLGVTIPTGKTRRPADLTAQDFGQGAWDAGAAHIVNFSPNPWLMLSNGTHYTARFKSSRIMRARTGPDDPIPDASTEENMQTWLGDKFWTNFDAQINLTSALSIDSSYEWYWKSKDRFMGSRNKDYSYLSDETDTFTGTLSAGLTLSTIPAFMKKDFVMPAQILLNYYWPLEGRNSIIAPYGTAELALYF